MHLLEEFEKKNIGWDVCTCIKWYLQKGWGSPNCGQSTMEKIGEDNRKARKTSWAINQMPTFGLENDKIWTLWALDVLLKNMLNNIWWCKCSKIESWNQTICCWMSCSNGGKHAWIQGGKRSHATLRCCWKRKVLICVKVSKKKGCWSTIT